MKKLCVFLIIMTILFTACSLGVNFASENGNMVNHISSEKILKLKPDMTYKQVVQSLGGKESLGYEIAGNYNYLIDGKYSYSIICNTANEDSLLLCSGEQLIDSIKSGLFGRYTGITEEKIKAIQADMTYQQVYCHLGATVNVFGDEKKYHFIYIINERSSDQTFIDDDIYEFTFDGPTEKIGYSGEEIWKAFSNGAPRSPADKLGYITDFDVKNQTFKLRSPESQDADVFNFSDKTSFVVLSNDDDKHFSYTGSDEFACQLQSTQLYWILVINGTVKLIKIKRI